MSSRRSSFSFSASTGSQRGSPLASAILPQSSVGPGPSLRCDSTARVGRRGSRTVSAHHWVGPGPHMIKKGGTVLVVGRRSADTYTVTYQTGGHGSTNRMQHTTAAKSQNGQRRRCNKNGSKTGGVKSSSSVCPVVARQCASNAYRPAQRTLLACHTGSSKHTGTQRGR